MLSGYIIAQWDYYHHSLFRNNNYTLGTLDFSSIGRHD